MLLYDCFTFCDELDLLDIRLAELSPVVDTFVIAEAPATFQDKRKPLYYQENKARFSQYAKQIRHVVVDDMPNTQNAWDRERHQRNSLRRGLIDATPDSMVLISDADEICTRAALTELKARETFSYIRLRMFAYFMNLEIIDGPNIPWIKVYGAPWNYIASMPDLTAPRNGDPQEFPQRYLEIVGMGPLSGRLIENGGWHFSWLGDANRILSKLHSFSHTEPRVEKWKNREFIARSIAKRHFFPSSGTLLTRAVDPSFPFLIQQREGQYLHDGLIASIDEPSHRHAGIAKRFGHRLVKAGIGRHISRACRVASRLKSTFRSRTGSILRRAVLRQNGALQQATSSTKDITSPPPDGQVGNDRNPRPVHVETIKDVTEVKRDLTHWIEQNMRPADTAPTAIALMEMGFERYLAMEGDESVGLELVKKTFTRAVQRHRQSEL